MGNYKDYYDKYALPDPVDERWRKFYLANLNCLDDNIGRILDAMDQLGLDENTLLVFFSDNGGSPYTGACNKPLSGGKYGLNEGGIRVPMMMRWPGRFPAGSTYPHVASMLDLLPTCLDVAGVGTKGVELDGVSLLDGLSGDNFKPVHEEPLVWKWRKQYAVRDGDWKLLKLENKENRLYNLKEDLAEEHDLAAQNPEKLKELLDIYNRWWSEMETSSKQYVK